MFVIMYSKDNKNKRYFSGKDGSLAKTIRGAMVFPDSYKVRAKQMILGNEIMSIKTIRVHPVRELLTDKPIKYSQIEKHDFIK